MIKKIIFILPLLFVLSAGKLTAQIDDINKFPDKIFTAGDTLMESYPLDRYYNYMRWQGLYSHSDLNYSGGIISRLHIYQKNSVSDNMSFVRIFLKETSDTILTTGDWDSSGSTMVFNGNIQTLSSPGWLTIQFSSWLYFPNSANKILISITRGFQQYITTYPQFAYSITDDYLVRRNRNDQSFPTILMQSYNRPIILFSEPLEVGGNSASSIPTVYSLSHNYPNPFNPTTKISYGIPKDGLVNLKIYNILGREVATLVNGEMKAGYYDLEFNASHLASGVYFYRIRVNDFVATRRMMLVK
jgi:hypothetical protein